MRSDITSVQGNSRQRGPVRGSQLLEALMIFKVVYDVEE
jgi:hypothetical protein